MGDAQIFMIGVPAVFLLLYWLIEAPRRRRQQYEAERHAARVMALEALRLKARISDNKAAAVNALLGGDEL